MNSNTALLQSCRCGFLCIANSHTEAHDLYLQHIFKATTEGHAVNRELAISTPIDNIAEVRNHLSALNRVERRREVEKRMLAYADSIAIAHPNKLAVGAINAAGISIVAILLLWDIWRIL